MSEEPAWLGPHLQNAADPERPPVLRLTLDPGGLVVELDESGLILGRHSEADVRLPLADISRKHCRFLYRDGAWLVLDLNSLNGTWVNDEQVHQVALRPGDVLRVGTYTFLVEVGERADGELAERIFRITPRVGPDLRRAG